MNALSHFPNFIFPSEVFSCAVNYLLKEVFTKLTVFPGNAMVSFLKVKKKKKKNSD